MSDTYNRVSRLLAQVLRLDESAIRPDSSLVGDLGAKSIDIIEVIMALEEEFAVAIPDFEVPSRPFKLSEAMTVKDLADLIEGA